MSLPMMTKNATLKLRPNGYVVVLALEQKTLETVLRQGTVTRLNITVWKLLMQ